MEDSSPKTPSASGAAAGRKRVLGALLLGALGGLASGQFLAGVPALHGFFPLGLLQDAGSGVARRFASLRGLEPNVAHPERRQQFELFSRSVDVVMIGDSITQAGMWDDMFPGIKIANRGIGSDRTDDVLRRMPSILSLRARTAFLMLGINDINADRGVDGVFADYIQIVATLRAQGVEVVVQSTLECNVALRRRCEALLPFIRELNGRLASFAAREGLHYVDLNELLTAPGEGLRARYTPDGVHLNGWGYLRWREAIAPLMPGP